MLAALGDTSVEDAARCWRRVRSRADDDLAILRHVLRGGSQIAVTDELAVQEGIGAQLLDKVQLDRDGVLGGLAFRDDLQGCLLYTSPSPRD